MRRMPLDSQYQSPVFGAQRIGPTFPWGYYDEAGEYQEVVVKMHPGPTFEEVAEFQQTAAIINARAVLAQEQVTKLVGSIVDRLGPDGKLDSKPETVAEDGTVTPAVEGTDMLVELQAAADSQLDDERERWELTQQQVLMLIAPSDRQKFEPLLVSANPTDVRALRDHLAKRVIDRVKDDVAAVAAVDPTSPPPSAT